jgi:hypothetical protein
LRHLAHHLSGVVGGIQLCLGELEHAQSENMGKKDTAKHNRENGNRHKQLG